LIACPSCGVVAREYYPRNACLYVVAAAVVTDRDTHDGLMLPGLVKTAAQHFNVEHVAADKA
jgi:hypothetical protein